MLYGGGGEESNFPSTPNYLLLRRILPLTNPNSLMELQQFLMSVSHTLATSAFR